MGPFGSIWDQKKTELNEKLTKTGIEHIHLQDLENVKHAMSKNIMFSTVKLTLFKGLKDQKDLKNQKKMWKSTENQKSGDLWDLKDLKDLRDLKDLKTIQGDTPRNF